jgi:small-conductance mechanosensitive channel
MQMNDFQDLVTNLGGSSMWLELLVLSVCLALAYGLARWLGRGHTGDSVWLGRRTLDGLLFPVLALVFVYAARYGLAQYQAVVVLKLALPIFLSLAAIRLCVRVLTASFPLSKTFRRLERWLSWLAWGVAVLWIVGLLPAVLAEMELITLTFGKTRVSLRTMAEGLLSSGLVLMLVLWLSATIEKRVLRQTVADLSMRKVAANMIRAALLLMGLLFVLSAIGVDLTALSVLGGAVGVGLGFGLQKLAANYVSGFVILLERSLRIGDTVKVDGIEGVVTDIKTRYTLIRCVTGHESIVPNELIITQRVENLSLADKKVLVALPVTVGYESDVDQVQRILLAAAGRCERVIKDPEPAAHLNHFGTDGLEFSLVLWIADPENGQLSLRSHIYLDILRELRAAGIDIPYPQRVVHMRSGEYNQKLTSSS